MASIQNKTVLITGGASGIGKLMGLKCLEKGASKLVIWDVNPEFLNQTTAEFRKSGYTIFPYLLDVSNVEAVKEKAEKVRAEAGSVDIVINNAGVVVGKEFKDHSHHDIDFTMNINTTAIMHVTLEFLQGMLYKGSGHIVNIASAAGLLANPKMSVYVASKWGVTGWSESLRIELETINSGICVTTVNPSYIDTGMFAGVRTNFLLPILKPERAVDKIIKAIEYNKISVRMPFLVNLLPFVRGIFPARLFDWFVGHVLGVYDSMAEFAGHDYYKSPNNLSGSKV
ncbi:MAG: SDR family oxidoreductase [Bacteroidales bacterium]|nr:SDR family oxidoreductase [Bacteroidales bacterium]